MISRTCGRMVDDGKELFYRKPSKLARVIWDDPNLRKIVILYMVTFFVILPLTCFKLPNSTYTVKSEAAKEGLRNRLKSENNLRVQNAFKYFDMLSQTGLHSALEKQTGELDLFVSIVTISRNRHKFDDYEPRYLTQVVWKLLEGYYRELAKGMKRKVKMAICNVDMDPNSYKEVEYLNKFIPVISRYKTMSLSMIHPLEKEKQDYVFCLNISMSHEPKYTLVIEDDALPHEDFFQVVDHMLRTKVEHGHDHYDGLYATETNVTFVKLYHPERLLGYINFEPDRLPELCGIALFFGTILYRLFSCIFLKSQNSSFLIWGLLGIYAALVAGNIGRPNLAELRRSFSPHFYTYVRAPECCTPAMIFPYEGAMHVIDYLNHTKCEKNFGKDMVLERMKRTKKITTFMVQPNLVTHIGLYSSLRRQILDPFVV